MVKRRDFLKAAALAAGTNASPASGTEADAGKAPLKSASTAGTLSNSSYPRQFTGCQLAMLAFPLGGVGAGSIGLGGRGQLRDWEIFNHPDKGRSPAYAFPAIRARIGTSEPVSRVLESRLLPPYEASGGLSPDRVSGLARLESAVFTGEYPLAKIAFHDRDLPVQVSLEAFTPIIPLDADASGLPVAILRYLVTNPASQAAEVSIAFSLDNPVGVGVRGEQRSGGVANKRTSEYRESGKIAGLLMTNPGTAPDAALAGSFALCVTGPGDGRVTYLRGWPRAKWWASPLLFWDDFTGDGQLGPEAAQRNSVGSVCLERTIAPGAKAEFTFLLAWHFPNRTTAFGWEELNGDASGVDPNAIVGNHYCQRFPDAWAAAEYTIQNLPALEPRMKRFLAAMRESTLPAPVKEAAMANLSTLVTPTCFRTADGKFRGFEGIEATKLPVGRRKQVGSPALRDCHGRFLHRRGQSRLSHNRKEALHPQLPSRQVLDSVFSRSPGVGEALAVVVADDGVGVHAGRVSVQFLPSEGGCAIRKMPGQQKRELRFCAWRYGALQADRTDAIPLGGLGPSWPSPVKSSQNSSGLAHHFARGQPRRCVTLPSPGPVTQSAKEPASAASGQCRDWSSEALQYCRTPDTR